MNTISYLPSYDKWVDTILTVKNEQDLLLPIFNKKQQMTSVHIDDFTVEDNKIITAEIYTKYNALIEKLKDTNIHSGEVNICSLAKETTKLQQILDKNQIYYPVMNV